MGMHHVNNKVDYQKQIRKAGSKLVIIKFFASWCGHCTSIAPAISQMCSEFKTGTVFLQVDIDENADITRDEYVVGVPTFVLYKNGQRVAVTSGESQLKQLILQHK